MWWETWWALVLGFAITGGVETFVSEETMLSYLGGGDWEEVGLGTILGAASSSCSFAAVSTAKSLFKKGASAPASIAAYQFAATDLVAELFLVSAALLGWEFVAAETLGGLIAVAIMAYIWMNFVPESVIRNARENVLSLDDIQCAACGMSTDPSDDDTTSESFAGETKYFCCGSCLTSYRHMERNPDEESTWQEQATSVEGWKDASRNTMKEWDMVWEDIFLGFVIASLLAAFIPKPWWATLFPSTPGFTGVVTAAVLGVGVAIMTFLCSVGNIPFALVLWLNGAPFGALLSFIFADMIIPPLLNMYRRYYGETVALIIFLTYAFAAVVAGVIVHYIFGFAGLIPASGKTGTTISSNYAVWMNILFSVVFVAQAAIAFGRDTVKNKIRKLPSVITSGLVSLRKAGNHIAGGLQEIGASGTAALKLANRSGPELHRGSTYLIKGIIHIAYGLSFLWRAICRLARGFIDLGHRIVEAVRIVMR